MSTDHQEYSTANQREAIAAFAGAHGLEIIKTYADEGRSGLHAAGREGLCSLLEDVASRRAEYRTILVYDVSRWGRFQDADEAAHYEYLCRRAGIAVEYCMEPFRNDGSPMASVIKGLKRVMAGEYSRELSVKVYTGKARILRLGFCPGGSAVYGLRRAIVDGSRVPQTVLERGQHKYLQSDRIIMVPGPKVEQDTVRWIFRQLVTHKRKPSEIARMLNKREAPLPGDRPWNRGHVEGILKNEKYIGNATYSRTSARLGTAMIRKPPEQWLRAEGVIEPILERKHFDAAQRVMASWSTRISNEDALALLGDLYRRRGTLSAMIINSAKGMPGCAFYSHRFGGLTKAFALVGFVPTRSYQFLSGYSKRCQLAREFRIEAEAQFISMNATVALESETTLLVNGAIRVALFAARCTFLRGAPRWEVQLHIDPRPDFVLVARLEPNLEIKDYFLFEGGSQSYLMGTTWRRRAVRRDRRQALSLRPLLRLVLGGAWQGKMRDLAATRSRLIGERPPQQLLDFWGD